MIEGRESVSVGWRKRRRVWIVAASVIQRGEEGFRAVALVNPLTGRRRLVDSQISKGRFLHPVSSVSSCWEMRKVAAVQLNQIDSHSHQQPCSGSEAPLNQDPMYDN